MDGLDVVCPLHSQHLSDMAWQSMNPSLLERSFFGLWMTLEGKFIQKEGARKVTIGIIVFLMRFSWQLEWSHSNIKRWTFTREFEAKNELSFPFVDRYLYIVISYHFDWRSSIFYGLFFLTSQRIFILDVFSKVWTTILLHICITITWSLVILIWS